MKKMYLRILLGIFALSLSSCEYPFSDDFFQELEIEDPSFTFQLLNFSDGDVLRSPKAIQYQYNAPAQNSLYEIRFYVNDELVEISAESTGTFFLDISNLSNGEHALKIEYYFRTNSGSIAETLGQESFVVTENYTFEVNKTAVPLEIDRIEHRDGSIFIHFNDYPLVDEIGISVTPTLQIFNQQGFYLTDIMLSKEIVQQGFFNDNASLDLNLRYKTVVQNYYGSVETDFTEINIPDTFELSISATDEGKFKFTYTQHPLYNNIGRMKIRYDRFDYQTEIGLPLNLTEYVYDNPFRNYVFGRNYEYVLTIENKTYYEFGYQYAVFSDGTYFRGEQFSTEAYNAFTYDSSTDRLYGLLVEPNGGVFIEEFNATTLASVQRNFITTVTQPYGDIVIAPNGNFIIDLHRKSLEIDRNSFAIVREENLSDYNIALLRPNTIVRHRRNTFVVDNVDRSNEVYIFDIPTKNLLLQGQKNRDHTFNISVDGNYFNLQDKIYQKTGVSLTTVYDDEFNRELDVAYNLQTQKAYLSGGYVREVDLVNSSVYQFPNLGNMDYMDYYPSVNTTLTREEDYNLAFHDVTTGTQEIKIIEIRDNRYFYIPEKNYLMSPYGFVLKNYR